jgi:hypothetical protein|eukprot:gene2785-3206_t
MKLNKTIICTGLVLIGSLFHSCKKFYDVNDDPNNVKDAPLAQLLPSITVNIGYIGASDLYRYSGLIMQQFSGQTTNTSQTFKEYERYNINNSDVNNQWNSIFAVVLADIAKLIEKAEATGSPHYAGVGKLMKAYIYQITVDAWGKVPYSEATKFAGNFYPKYDDDEAIYKDLIKLIDAGIADINAANSVFEPDQTSTIFIGKWTDVKPRWIRFANTLKLRLYLHYSQKDPSFASTQITTLINSGAIFMDSNADNFQMRFSTESGRQNPNASIEGGQFKNSFFPNRYIVNLMNSKADPRRPSYFVPFPYNSNPATYKGASVLDNASVAYSRLNTYLKGDTKFGTIVVNPDGTITDGSITWQGNSYAKLLTYAEYNFIRAEAALNLGAAGDAQSFFQAGIRASMSDAGVLSADIDAYITANGTLNGTNAQKLEQIINEKYVANFGVVMEPWTDWRRTGYPAITPLPISVAVYDKIPRSIIYPLSERNSNPNTPARTDLLQRVFWDTRP